MQIECLMTENANRAQDEGLLLKLDRDRNLNLWFYPAETQNLYF